MRAGIDYIGVGVGAVIVNSEKKLFLAKRGPKAENEIGKWEFPGGIVELGETLEHAVKREVQEEYGLTVAVVDLLDVCNHILPDEAQHWLSPAFLCKVIDGVPHIREPETCEQIGWFDREAIDLSSVTVATKHNIAVLLDKYPDELPNLYHSE
jgi:8-oxo-dGTP diphosphatase